MPFIDTPETNALKSKVEKLLSEIPDFTDENKNLKINVIKDYADNGNIKLLEPLLKNPQTKKAFFLPVLDSFVFNTAKFKEFLEYSSACNSYSKYLGQKIGLYMGDSSLLDRNEVVLNFPFKDCVLEGGQRKEDGLDTYYEYNDKKGEYTEKQSKRREVFYNEVLAQDEIDSLFSPKAFCNAKRYEKRKSEKCTKLNRDAELNKKRGLAEDTITDNLIIKGNNLLALHSLKKEFAGKVKLIYIDPPYNTGSDTFSYNDSFNRSSWLTFMKNRLEVAKELLSPDGAIYVQLDYHQVHYAKILLDNIFGENNFQREIIWRIGWLSGYKTIDNNWIRNHDTILFYSKNTDSLSFNKYYIQKSDFKSIADSKAEQYPIEDVWNGNEYDDLNSIAIVSFSGETVSKMLNKNDEIKGQKSEKLIERIIRAHTSEKDIVLDFFGGTGTTAAVALKMNRQFIICEQIDKHVDISLRRLQKVEEGEQSGISKRNNWQGGGSFVYLELAKKNETALEQISACKSLEELTELFDELCSKYFLHYNVRVKEFRKEIESERFKQLNLKQQKEMFSRMLDLNQLYVNTDDRHDKNTGLTEDDIAITEDFYQLAKDGE
ncbi:MAG: DNA methyltransferase [Spirochaetales bacterium]|nr:DNA methyltransferase [Spirochaetales bacterium]MDY5914163.1 DNA methyltransferase [Treponema sp.]